MRGIEGALHVLDQVRKGRFASEALRNAGRGMAGPDLTLASSLVYAVLRRREMWRTTYEGFTRGGGKGKEKLPPLVQDCLLAGTAGLLELRHFAGGALVNGLLDCLKRRNLNRWVSLVNAVLRCVGERGSERVEALRKSPSLEDRALWAGVPVWSLPAWTRTWQRTELNELFDFLPQQPRSALRPAPGKRDELLKRLAERGMEAEPSELSEALHLSSTVLPTEVPGFDEGLCTVQTEGAVLVASLAAKFYKGGLILDMCSGRGVKAGQLLQSLSDARLEGWELSEGRHRSAKVEMKRLGVQERVTLRRGNALELEPSESPSLVLLDAPCSGSGTWTRKPESKWRLNWKEFDRLAASQRRLLERALTLCASGGIIVYVTCSLLRQENENVVAEGLSHHPECAELPSAWDSRSGPFHRGRPWGTYIWPETPWLDGFYCAVILKK
ncbi:MAG: RsmB/NOP family class I SAM-dependent RNA methyltransferase [Synergistaceae bacterium]|nr:RsmB/NOP family class I SAM-dependent RNA methyltransferase [Synergistaceae bacterium]